MQGKNVTELKKPIDPDLIPTLEGLIERVKAGEIIGITAFLLYKGSGYNHISVGEDMSLSELMMTFESWKFEQFLMQHLVKGSE